MANLTPEKGNLGFVAEPPAPKCGWCKNVHVADTKCSCEEKCGVGWCAPFNPEEEPFYL